MALAAQGYTEHSTNGPHFLYSAPNVVITDDAKVTMKKFLGIKMFRVEGVYPGGACQLSHI